jgi:NTP pyrophosphatase (non-canonical NTP hydrolase)
MEALQKLMDWNRDFCRRVFPKHADDPVAPLHHLKEEVEEVIESVKWDQASDKLEDSTLEEYADCLILLVGSATRLGITAEQLLEASFDKMQKNEERDWGEPDEKGVYKHIKSES